jgi:Fic-DOC domain mobile mystery protein B
MSFILNHKYSDGNTPIRAEDAAQLIPKISTISELNQYETLNILEAQNWAFSTRTMNSRDPLEETYVRALHSRMFNQVWQWAGTYRRHELNIGCAPENIMQRVPQLLGNTKYWLENATYPIDESLVRFHHELVSRIHPFPNGNGRHARMLTDVIAVKYGRPQFTWGANQNLVAETGARAAYLAALRALDASQADVHLLLAFARS